MRTRASIQLHMVRSFTEGRVKEVTGLPFAVELAIA
jgi:hypothetical protein